MTEKKSSQGLKPVFLVALVGTAKAVPVPKPIFETSLVKSSFVWDSCDDPLLTNIPVHGSL
jgi:hypothetical protein